MRTLLISSPDSAILVEPHARHTGENFDLTRELVAARRLDVSSIVVTCRPYQQLRAYTTAKARWPGIEVLCSAAGQTLPDYVASIGDADRVANMLVGDTQRLTVYAQAGHAIPCEIPDHVHAAYQRLVDAGYTARLIPES